MIEKLLYAQDGVHQCWTCKNMIGRAEFKTSICDTDGWKREIICVLPECKVANQYMTIVYETPCSKYACWNEKEATR